MFLSHNESRYNKVEYYIEKILKKSKVEYKDYYSLHFIKSLNKSELININKLCCKYVKEDSSPTKKLYVNLLMKYQNNPDISNYFKLEDVFFMKKLNELNEVILSNETKNHMFNIISENIDVFFFIENITKDDIEKNIYIKHIIGNRKDYIKLNYSNTFNKLELSKIFKIKKIKHKITVDLVVENSKYQSTLKIIKNYIYFNNFLRLYKIELTRKGNFKKDISNLTFFNFINDVFIFKDENNKFIIKTFNS